MKPEDRVDEIKKEIIKVSIIDTPGSIMVGLGLYGKFGAEGNAFHPLLNDQTIVNGLLIIGGAIMIWGVIKITSLSRESAKLKERINQ